MEQRYGKKVIRQVIEESFSRAWLEEFSKKCPQCNTNIQVRYFIVCPFLSNLTIVSMKCIYKGIISISENRWVQQDDMH